MHNDYHDIWSRIDDEIQWHDSNGVPRYDKFEPSMCPNIYSDTVVLLQIGCQDCGRQFKVEMHTGWLDRLKELVPKKWHYGDPPAHGCVGDTMNCVDNKVLEVWVREPVGGWRRRTDLEVRGWRRRTDLEGACE